MIFDTHAHYDDEQFEADREELLTSLHAGGIGAIAEVGYKKSSILKTHELADRHDFIYEVLGWHPDEVGELEAEENTIMDWYREQLKRPKVVGVGEIGLDYYWDKNDHEIQKKWFRNQLLMAEETDLPVVIHSREAAQDTFDLIRDMGGSKYRMDIHCYSYSLEMAKEYLKMGFYLGIGGVVTFKNARKTKEVVEYMPLDRILLETDCPYLAPVPFRGKRNDSGKIDLVIQEIARIKQVDPGLVEETCWKNALEFYRLSL